ncbi:hypothetical protein OBBRIDRAFT_168858 [Obba rivulosa]|uniref:Secreted protein n=1 Tax=Obba rivulosa TaxID=1052685 RepID=A0A8E2DHP6_9APHY|nr:hypothetical protein OBBRIDRAFT_168858 [Obba rivulosa]
MSLVSLSLLCSSWSEFARAKRPRRHWRAHQGEYMIALQVPRSRRGWNAGRHGSVPVVRRSERGRFSDGRGWSNNMRPDEVSMRKHHEGLDQQAVSMQSISLRMRRTYHLRPTRELYGAWASDCPKFQRPRGARARPRAPLTRFVGMRGMAHRQWLGTAGAEARAKAIK